MVSTVYRDVITGTENIFAIEVDDNGYVYVADFIGSDAKTGRDQDFQTDRSVLGTTWGDARTTTMHRFPPSIYPKADTWA
ncbi:MAG: hypothetical protein R3C26_16940 [Calditrichia bacterium]